ncbi:MAG: peptide deformylase [Negativicutes bacterium]|nr:peptide deformylase [Negativicutes bacterium]
MILQIRKNGDAILKKVAKPVGRIDKRIQRLLDDMAETMYAADGVGLAAPQVGHSLRIFIVDIGQGLQEYINPEFVEMSGTVVDREGCLSVPDFTGDVARAARVVVRALDRYGKSFTVTASGLLARALQHENDHLEGVLFIERASALYDV